MRPASNLDDLVAVEPVGAGIAVSLQEAPERPKMVLGALTLTAYLATSTGASRPGPARPRAIGRDGASLCTIRSQRAHGSLGLTCRTTRKLVGTCSSISETSSPRRRKGPSQAGQLQAGSCTISSRGK